MIPSATMGSTTRTDRVSSASAGVTAVACRHFGAWTPLDSESGRGSVGSVDFGWQQDPSTLCGKQQFVPQQHVFAGISWDVDAVTGRRAQTQAAKGTLANSDEAAVA